MAQGSATALAGGTDVVMLRAAGTLPGGPLVDLKGVADLRGMEPNDGGLTIGAAATMAELRLLDPARFGALVDGASVVGSTQTRNRATVGGNVCRASPAGDTLAPLLVLGAEVQIASTAGTRTVALREFFLGPGRTALAPNELAVRLFLPAIAGASAYERQCHREWLDLAIAGVAVRLVVDEEGCCTDAAVAVAALAPTPLLVPEAAAALRGRPPASAVDESAAAVVAAAQAIDDARSSAAYRTAVVPALLAQAVARALERCGR
jgi:carbon-monoxide dehydrogenase medium subunit